MVYAVVGMKSDLSETQREVTTDMLNSFASHFNIRPECVFEVSARTGKGVEDMLKALCDRVVLQFRGESATAEREAVEGGGSNAIIIIRFHFDSQYVIWSFWKVT